MYSATVSRQSGTSSQTDHLDASYRRACSDALRHGIGQVQPKSCGPDRASRDFVGPVLYSRRTMNDTAAGTWHLHRGDGLDVYNEWPTPGTIVSDGAYGVGGFPGDPRTPEGLRDWYAPHVEAWSSNASLATTLWFWNTEVGWANVHPLLVENGWKYEFTNVWNKGVGHVAGNVNSLTIRRFPVVTEV